MAYKGEVEPGLFMGISKNIGASHKIIPSITDPHTGKTERLIYDYDFENIDFVYRVSPRIRWFLKPFIFAGELEITGARYGNITETVVLSHKMVNNVRTLLRRITCFKRNSAIRKFTKCYPYVRPLSLVCSTRNNRLNFNSFPFFLACINPN
jgi:hypothetical protein